MCTMLDVLVMLDIPSLCVLFVRLTTITNVDLIIFRLLLPLDVFCVSALFPSYVLLGVCMRERNRYLLELNYQLACSLQKSGENP